MNILKKLRNLFRSDNSLIISFVRSMPRPREYMSVDNALNPEKYTSETVLGEYTFTVQRMLRGDLVNITKDGADVVAYVDQYYQYSCLSWNDMVYSKSQLPVIACKIKEAV